MRSRLFCVVAAISLSLGSGGVCLAEGPEPKETEASASIERAKENYLGMLNLAKAAYRKELAEIVGRGTEVEVFLLDSLAEPDEDAKNGVINWQFGVADDRFPLVPYKSTARILARKKLSADEIQGLMPSLKETVGVQKESGGAFCHYQIHGIRVKSGEDLLLQTSICYECGNFYLSYPYGEGAEWVGLNSDKFREMMTKLMPIPEKEKKEE